MRRTNVLYSLAGLVAGVAITLAVVGHTIPAASADEA